MEPDIGKLVEGLEKRCLEEWVYLNPGYYRIDVGRFKVYIGISNYCYDRSAYGDVKYETVNLCVSGNDRILTQVFSTTNTSNYEKILIDFYEKLDDFMKNKKRRNSETNSVSSNTGLEHPSLEEFMKELNQDSSS